MAECSAGAHRSPIGFGCPARRFRGANVVFQDRSKLYYYIHVFTCWRGRTYAWRDNFRAPGKRYIRCRSRNLRNQWNIRCDVWEQTKRFPRKAAESQRGRIRKQRDFPGGWYLSANLKGPTLFRIRSGGSFRWSDWSGPAYALTFTKWGVSLLCVCFLFVFVFFCSLFENACS